MRIDKKIVIIHAYKKGLEILGGLKSFQFKKQ